MYVLHDFPDTASLIVRLLLEEMGQPYEVRLIDRAGGGALGSAAYRALHPLGLIPVLETPDGAIFETAAILLYLCERHPGLAPAPGSPERAAFLKWLFFTSSNIHPQLMQLYHPERTAGPENSAAAVSHAKARLTELLTILEAMVEGDNPSFLSQNAATALGYYLAVLLRWLADDFPIANYPALHRVLSGLEARPATRTVAAAENLGATPFSNP